jgi:hypothetical protein
MQVNSEIIHLGCELKGKRTRLPNERFERKVHLECFYLLLLRRWEMRWTARRSGLSCRSLDRDR